MNRTQESLKYYLGVTLVDIGVEIVKNGIIFESQFEKLGSKTCKTYCSEIVEALKEIANKDIGYGYDNKTKHFYFYDENKYSYEEAFEESVKFQSDKEKMIK